MFKELQRTTSTLVVMTVLVGVVYPYGVTALSRALFPAQAAGSLIEKGGKVIGSQLIGQNFAGEGYFHPRPSVAGKGYDAAASSGSNAGPTNKALIDRVTASVADLRQTNAADPIPADLVTTSGSGLDPHISPAAAAFQVARVARVRGMSSADVSKLVADHTEGRTFGLLGEPRINVLLLNLELDRTHPLAAGGVTANAP